MHAHFPGKCRNCGKSVAKGEEIYFAKHYGVRCLSCGPHPENEQPLPPRKGSKRANRQDARKSEPTPVPDMIPTHGNVKGRAARQGADGVYRYEYASVTEAVETALEDWALTDHNREAVRAKMREHLTGHDSWAHHYTLDKFMQDLANPPQELLDAINGMRQELIDELDLPTAPRRKVRHGQDDGDELDPDRWVNREPNAWDRNVREPQPRRTVTIGCNLTVSAHRRPEELLYRGAAACALADILSERGVNVGIIGFSCEDEPTNAVGKAVMKYVVKDPTMPMDLSACAFAMCEIAFFRIVSAIGEIRHLPGRMNGHLGFPQPLPAADRQGLDYLIEVNCTTRESAVSWLKGQTKVEECNV
jgi:hypothetical protein